MFGTELVAMFRFLYCYTAGALRKEAGYLLMSNDAFTQHTQEMVCYSEQTRSRRNKQHCVYTMHVMAIEVFISVDTAARVKTAA